MPRASFKGMSCSVARTLDVVGERWTPLIVRDILLGVRRFDAMQRDLGISRKVLAERLRGLVESGMLERRRYSSRPARHEYVLTEKGLEFCEILLLMTAWGDRWTAGDAGPPVLHRHRGCGQITKVELSCSRCGEPVHAGDIEIEDGPGSR